MTTAKRAHDTPTVRPAKPTDSKEAAELIYMTGKGLFRYLFYPDMNRTVAVLRQLFEMEDNDFSHQNACIAQLELKTACIIVFTDRVTTKNNYHKMGWKIMKVMGFWPFVNRLPRFIRVEGLIPKLADTTLYINHIAVFNKFRGRGVATHLLRYCDKQARARGLTRLALDVEVDNDSAIQIYEHVGFKKMNKVESKTLFSKFGFRGLYRMEKKIGS